MGKFQAGPPATEAPFQAVKKTRFLTAFKNAVTFVPLRSTKVLALLAASLEMELLRKLFGGFLIAVGLVEIFCKGLQKNSA